MSDFTKSRISGTDSFSTPKELYDSLDLEFHFNDDACPLSETAIDGLLREWGTSVFMNPPYSNPSPWCMKAAQEAQQGKIVVGLLRGDTSTKWFHEWVLPYAEIRFVKGRVKFSNNKPAPFPSIIAIWRKREVSNG